MCFSVANLVCCKGESQNRTDNCKFVVCCLTIWLFHHIGGFLLGYHHPRIFYSAASGSIQFPVLSLTGILISTCISLINALGVYWQHHQSARLGIEPTTHQLIADCSTTELHADSKAKLIRLVLPLHEKIQQRGKAEPLFAEISAS